MASDESQGLALRAGLVNLDEFRAYIDRVGTALGLGSPLLGDLRLVVDEAVTNIVLHGYGGKGGPVELQLAREGGDIVVLIRDEAPPFNPDAVEEPDLDAALPQRKPGGMGIFLMRQMMDEVVFQPQPGGGNELGVPPRSSMPDGEIATRPVHEPEQVTSHS
jgi:anti-sigma regulatory factor (Ser/Thr protein kinase)